MNMKRNTIYAIAGGIVAVLVVGLGLFLYVGRPANRVPALPANARMFNNWALVGCRQNANDGRCVLLRRAVNQQTQRLIMQMTIARAPNGSPIMAVTLPPNVVIPSGITLTPMGGTAVKGAIRACRPQACTAAVVVTDDLAKEMAATDTTALEFVAANGRAIRMNVNIQGFAQGYPAWQAAAPATAIANPASAAAAPAQPTPAAAPAAKAAAAAAQPPAPAGKAQPAAKAAAPAGK
jgi:invasion protein IalB